MVLKGRMKRARIPSAADVIDSLEVFGLWSCVFPSVCFAHYLFGLTGFYIKRLSAFSARNSSLLDVSIPFLGSEF